MAFYRHRLQEEPNAWALAHLRDREPGDLLALDSNCAWATSRTAGRSVAPLRVRRHEIVAAGLASVTKDGYLVDRFRDRVIIAAHDRKLRPVGFIGHTGGNRLRYLSTSATEIYAKAQTLVGLDAQVDRYARVPLRCSSSAR